MLRLDERLAPAALARVASATLTLPFELRRRSRLLLKLDDGEEAGLFLDRGTVLRDGDELRAGDGRIVRVVAAQESVYRVKPGPGCTLARAAYHLGNRHVPVEIGDGWLRLERDLVLREMLLLAGAIVDDEVAPFQPEAGAYGGGHRHGHDEGFDEEHALVRNVYALRHGSAAG